MEQKDYRLAAILYTDIVGFSKMMEAHESRTLELLHLHNALVQEAVCARGGNVIKTIGDAFLVDFKNTVDALQCAIDIQYKLYEYNKKSPDLPLLLRIGVHLGDIYFYENDALGEGINIAARLQSIAHPGCICMSQNVYNLVLNKVDFKAEQLGQVSLKNISREIHVWEIATPNIEFDERRHERTILKPQEVEEKVAEKLEKLNADPAAELKRKIMLDIKAAGRRLSADQMLLRYGSEGEWAATVIEELTLKGMLVREAPKAASSSLGETLASIGKLIEAEVVPEINKAIAKHTEKRAMQAEAANANQIHLHFKHERGNNPDQRREDRLSSTPFRSAADSVNDAEIYERDITREAGKERAGFFTHALVFIAVNAFLMFLNTKTGSFPWALFPFGGWGIGLLEHLTAVMRKDERRRELKKLPPLNAEQLSLFKKLQKKKDSFWSHLSSTVATGVFLFMINAITSPSVPWSIIVNVFMGIGLLSHLGKYNHQKKQLEKELLGSFGLEGSWTRTVKNMPKPLTEAYGSVGRYRALVDEAHAVRASIIAGLQPKKGVVKKGNATVSALVDKDFVPSLDACVREIGTLAAKTTELDTLLSSIPSAELEKEKQELREKRDQASSEPLVQEYNKSLSEIERHEKSCAAVKDQIELLELRMKSSVTALKQMRMDLARLSGLESTGGELSAAELAKKTNELNKYLEDLRAGYEELGLLDETST